MATRSNKNNSINDKDLVDWIIREEGFNTKPEDIGDGKVTLGSGLTDPKWHALYKKKGNKWSEEDNRRAVAEEVANRRKWAEKTIPNWEALPDSSQKALLSYKYNYDFTPTNSPKLFQALADSNLKEAARQMDATSKDPKFKKGLQERRQREQEWFLSEVEPEPESFQVVPNTIHNEIPVSTAVYTPYRTAVNNTAVPTTVIPDSNSYITTHRITPLEDRSNRVQEALNGISDYSRLMRNTSIVNNPIPQYSPNTNIKYAEGGYLNSDNNLTSYKDWNSLSMREKSEYMKTAIRNGITTLPEIKQAYNQFAEGGNLYKKGGHKDEGYNNFVAYTQRAEGAHWQGQQDKFKREKGKSATQYYWDEAKKRYKDKWDKWTPSQRIAVADTMYNYGYWDGTFDAYKYDMNVKGVDNDAYWKKYGKGHTRRFNERKKMFYGNEVPEMIAAPKDANIRIPSVQEYAEPFIPTFMPSNPEAFFTPLESYQRPVIEEVVEQPLVKAANAYSQEALDREQRQRNLNTLNFVLGMTSPQESDNSFVNTIGMLTGNINADGGKIHIKPENRGKFTALKKRTGHSASWFKEHGTPAQKKMATFELNARKWKHGLGGNLFETGGPEKKWKALDNIDFVAIPDTSFTRDKTGMGSIEYFDTKFPEGITYPNGYHREHPLPGKDVILYNPNDNDEQDVRLDALHIMPKDATYDALNTLYRNAALDSDVSYNAKAKYNEDAERYGKDNIDSYEQYFNNEADGLLRNMFIEGTPEYIESKRYYPNKSELRKWNTGLLPYINAIQNYLVTGERPANILPEVTIIEKRRKSKKRGYGGNLYGGITGSTQQMQTGKDYWTQLANKPTWLDTFITPINGGQLSEVVVKPTNDESWLFSLGKYARNSRKPLADSHARKVVANYLSRFDNESAKDYNARISRLADTLDIRGVQFTKNNVESGKLKNRAHYDSKSNTAYIDDIQDIFAEIAHPWQDAIGNNSMNDEFKKGNYDPDIDSRGGTRYAYPDTFEGETHGFFQPALTEWVETGKIGRSLPLLNEDLSNEKIVPKDNIEVLDSAASWNKQAIDKRVIANPHQLPLTKRIQYIIWDYPLLDKRKAYGGNLFDDGGSYSYTKPLNNVFVDEYGNLLDPNVPSARGTILLPDLEVTANPIDVGRGEAARVLENAFIESNDATATPYSTNSHLDYKGIEGMTQAAAWMKDHPTLNNVGMTLGAAPFAVAGYPAFMAAGEGAATALTNPYVDAALTSGFGAHGLQSIANGEANWTTALEIAPLGRLVKPMWNAGKEAVYNIADRYIFMPHQNSFTRGIGGETGLQDLVESGLVRGNPVGTEVSANMFGKMYRRNRWHFRDIMDATGREGIAQRYFNRTLSEEDFNAIKKAAEPYVKEYNTLPEEKSWIVTAENPDPLERYLNYNDYKSVLSRDRQTLARATSMDDSGQPLAYFYDNGRNPLTAGHDYAASDYGVRINNASWYNPRIFDGHLHYSMPKAVSLRDPNVEVFEKGPFGLTVKLDKETMNPLWEQDLKALFSKGTNKAPQITTENAASITPEQWTTAQDAAIARGDMTEAQRLRDLHFKVKTPNNKYRDHAYHNTNTQFNEFKPEFMGKTDSGYYGEGFYFTPNKIDANNALGPIQKDVYVYLENPREITSSDYISGQLINNDGAIVRNGEEGWITLDGTPPPDPNEVMEVVSNIPSRIKLADAITYDDKGVRIPLGERDNFNINDIRYGLLPFIGLGTAGTLYGRNKKGRN